MIGERRRPLTGVYPCNNVRLKIRGVAVPIVELDKTGVPGAGAGRSGRPAIETNRTEVLIQIGAPRTTAASHRMVSGASHRKVSGDSNAINVRTYLLICMTKVMNVDEATDVGIAFTQIMPLLPFQYEIQYILSSFS